MGDIPQFGGVHPKAPYLRSKSVEASDVQSCHPKLARSHNESWQAFLCHVAAGWPELNEERNRRSLKRLGTKSTGRNEKAAPRTRERLLKLELWPGVLVAGSEVVRCFPAWIENGLFPVFAFPLVRVKVV